MLQFFFLSAILFSGCVSICLLLWGKDYDHRFLQFFDRADPTKHETLTLTSLNWRIHNLPFQANAEIQQLNGRMLPFVLSVDLEKQAFIHNT